MSTEAPTSEEDKESISEYTQKNGTHMCIDKMFRTTEKT